MLNYINLRLYIILKELKLKYVIVIKNIKNTHIDSDMLI